MFQCYWACSWLVEISNHNSKRLRRKSFGFSKAIFCWP